MRRRPEMAASLEHKRVMTALAPQIVVRRAPSPAQRAPFQDQYAGAVASFRQATQVLLDIAWR
jgi:hypothetical protein